MPLFKLPPEDSKQISKITFHKITDYKAVTLEGSDKPILLHKIHADNLVKKKAASYVKDAQIEEVESTMIVTPNPNNPKSNGNR